MYIWPALEPMAEMFRRSVRPGLQACAAHLRPSPCAVHMPN